MRSLFKASNILDAKERRSQFREILDSIVHEIEEKWEERIEKQTIKVASLRHEIRGLSEMRCRKSNGPSKAVEKLEQTKKKLEKMLANTNEICNNLVQQSEVAMRKINDLKKMLEEVKSAKTKTPGSERQQTR